MVPGGARGGGRSGPLSGITAGYRSLIWSVAGGGVLLAIGVAALVLLATGLVAADPSELRTLSVAVLALTVVTTLAGVGWILIVERRARGRAAPLEPALDALRKALVGNFSTEIEPGGEGDVGDLSQGIDHLLRTIRRVQALHQSALDMLESRDATALHAAALHRDAARESETDPLTQVYNRRRLDADLADMCRKAGADGKEFAFIMADIDHFKKFNDTYGHQEGDALLRGFAALLSREMRGRDAAYRYGGEEFALIVATGVEGGRACVERLRSRMAEHFVQAGRSVTASFGLAVAPLHATEPKALIAAADGALYRAKHEGRDRLIVADPPTAMTA